MSLPMMATPTFKTTIPSTGQEITYRPFLVKEEKILLMALEGGSGAEMANAAQQILQSCIVDDINVNDITTFDMEFLFLQLRGKSVNEVIELRVGHTEGKECKHKTEVEINLDDIKVQGIKDDKEKTIMLTDTVGVKVKYPTIDVVKSISDGQKSNSETAFELIAKCIDVVFDEENVYDDYKEGEILEWLENLNQSQYAKLSVFFESLPKLKHDIEWTCKECGEKDSFEVEGLQSFFTYA